MTESSPKKPLEKSPPDVNSVRGSAGKPKRGMLDTFDADSWEPSLAARMRRAMKGKKDAKT